MLKERAYIYRRLNLFGDVFIAGISFLIAMLARVYLETGSFVLSEHYRRYFWLIYIVMVMWPFLLNVNGIYPTNRLRTVKRATGIIIKSSLQGLFAILAFLFILRLQIVSRLIITGFSVIAAVFYILKESIVISLLRLARESGANLRNVLVVGTINSSRDIVTKIEKNSFLGLKIIGLLVPSQEVGKKETQEQNILGTLKEIENVLHSNPINQVVITLDRKDYREIDEVVFHCEEEGVEIWITPNIFNIKIAHLDADEFFGTPIFVLRTGPKFSWEIFIKSILDRIGGLVFTILSLPIIAVAGIFIKLTSPGPVLFKQQRCSVQGRIFTLYKLRTMYIGAEDMQKRLEDGNIMKGPIFKLKEDPRITTIGRFLRRMSIDEMPQFWNVLKGDMSLIGPRPPIPSEVKRYDGWQRRRLSMKPGITGLWQISGRSSITDFNKLTSLDLAYIDNWSLWFDLKIFFKTIWVVLTAEGAE
jgi:exopolysaccharide biosynthesis polyprenyl glycosylphosphotransferase